MITLTEVVEEKFALLQIKTLLFILQFYWKTKIQKADNDRAMRRSSPEKDGRPFMFMDGDE